MIIDPFTELSHDTNPPWYNTEKKKSVWLLVVLRPIRDKSLLWRRHQPVVMAANFYIYSALMAIEQRGFFSVPHLLWHVASVYNGHLRGPVTLTPTAERLALELSLPVFKTSVCRGPLSPTFRLQGELSNPLRYHRGFWILNLNWEHYMLRTKAEIF